MHTKLNDNNPTIKVAYTDFWDRFYPEQTYLIQLLSQDYQLVEDTHNPDVVLCSVFGFDARNYDCPRIQYIGEPISANFVNYDYIIGFDRLSFPGRYLRVPLYLLQYPEWGTVALTRQKHLFEDDFYDKKDKFCAFVCSDPDNTTKRYDFFRLLNEKKRVDSAGRQCNNMGGVACKDKIEFLRSYRFNIAFENTIKEGYITEKITDAFAAGCIPIYLGDPHVELDFNKDSFINVNDFSSFDECIDYVLYVDEHPELYRSYLRAQAFARDFSLDQVLEHEVLGFFHSILDEKPIRHISDSNRIKQYARVANPSILDSSKNNIKAMIKGMLR